MKEFDLVTIGGGSGGIAAANRAAENGAKVAVIEENVLGGTCVNRGCVPKKVAWYGSRVSEAINLYGPGYGFHAQDVDFNYAEFKEASDGYVSRSRQGYYSRFDKNDIELIDGHATLLGNNEIDVNGETIKAKYIIIATGGRPSKVEVPGGEYLNTSDDFFNWTDLPESVAVVGAGYIAVEFAQLLHGFGVDTHLAVRHDRPLRTFDKLVVSELVEAIEKNGPTLHTHTDFDEYRKNDAGQIECYQDGKLVLTVDRVIQAIGRTPNTENIGLVNTAATLTKSGHLEVNDQHETSEPNVYGVGDVLGKLDLTPVAIRAGRQISEHLFNDAPSSAIEYTDIPSVIFSHPAIGTIGLTEDEAVDKYGEDDLTVYTNKFYSMYASAGGQREANHFKLVCQGPNEKVIGLHGIGEGVDEMIQGFGVAMKMGATKADFDSVVAIHPTGAEEFVTMR